MVAQLEKDYNAEVERNATLNEKLEETKSRLEQVQVHEIGKLNELLNQLNEEKTDMELKMAAKEK
jgi:hypothetical protein